MHRLSSQLTIAAVALLLGVLVVVQLRTQTAGSGLEALSAQDLTLLVANIDTRNDQLRTEVADLERQLRELSAGQARGDTSLDQVRDDLARTRAWSGLVAVTGEGIIVSIGGPIAGSGVEDLLNELHNAGAEAIGVAGIRVVPGVVASGLPGQLSIEDTALTDPFEIAAIGHAETLTGSLTRIGGIVAQLAATYPDASVSVTPVGRVDLPATERILVPSHGRPRL